VKFLHTADWHLGKPLKGRSRLSEQEQVLAEILDLARRESVDCLLVSGDLFDSYIPPPEAERLVFNFLAELVGRGIAAVIIGGNHDHPKRLAALRQLLDPLRVYIRPEPARPQDGGVLELGRDGEIARIAVLPFVPERKVVDFSKLLGPEEGWHEQYGDRVSRMCELLTAGFSSSTINLLVAHLYLHGAATSGSERAIHVAQPYAVSAARLPPTAHYVALGHLHRPQEIAAPSRTVYAGSPLQLDFGEQGQQKRVVLVEARPGRPARIESLPLASGRRLRSIQGALAEIEARAADFGDDFLQVTVLTEGPAPGVSDRIRELLPNALDVRIEYPKGESPDQSAALRNLPPEEIFRQYYESHNSAPPPQALTALFRQLYEEELRAAD